MSSKIIDATIMTATVPVIAFGPETVIVVTSPQKIGSLARIISHRTGPDGTYRIRRGREITGEIVVINAAVDVLAADYSPSSQYVLTIQPDEDGTATATISIDQIA